MKPYEQMLWCEGTRSLEIHLLNGRYYNCQDCGVRRGRPHLDPMDYLNKAERQDLLTRAAKYKMRSERI